MSEEKHANNTENHQPDVDEKIAHADIDRGVLVVNTGKGKGKSSSAFGMVMRALGHGMRVGIVQFVKERTDSGEQLFLEKCHHLFSDTLELHVMDEGRMWGTQDQSRDMAQAQVAWSRARALLTNPKVGLVLLLELNLALRHGYLNLDTVLADLDARPHFQHVIVTGRDAPQKIVDVADTVTEMTLVKHAFNAGVRAQKGLEW